MQQAAAEAARTGESFRTSPLVLIVAGVLVLVAAYLLIRLLEWDMINRETPDQDDPFGK